MISVKLADEPANFDQSVRQPGRRALLELIGDPSLPPRRGPKRKVVANRIEEIQPKDLPQIWTKALGGLRGCYGGTCCYLGMKIHPAAGAATVDHFKPKSRYQCLAYEWSNLRLACAQVNTNKGDREGVLDPVFEVNNGWFVLNIGNFHVEPAADLSVPLRDRVARTIEILKLNAATYCLARQEYHDHYHGLRDQADQPLPLWWLEQESPYVAFELKRQGRLRRNDTHEEGGSA